MVMDYGFFGDAFLSATAGIFGIVLAIMLVIGFLVAIVTYVLSAVGMFTIGQRRGLRLYGLAWVPFGAEWLLGSIADQFDRKAKGKDLHLRLFLLIGEILGTICAIVVLILAIQALMGISMLMEDVTVLTTLMIFYVLMILFTVAFSVFYYIALYKVYRSCTPQNCVWMLVLSIFFKIATPICLICIKNKDDGFLELQRKAREAQTTE